MIDIFFFMPVIYNNPGDEQKQIKFLNLQFSILLNSIGVKCQTRNQLSIPFTLKLIFSLSETPLVYRSILYTFTKNKSKRKKNML